MKIYAKFYVIIAMFFLIATIAAADVRVSDLFSDGVVLQRGEVVKVWGSADKGEEVVVTFALQQFKAVADEDGRWQVQLKPMSANKENRQMVISGEANEIKIDDILVGDVWVCSGQSNMYFELARITNAEKFLVQATNPDAVRAFFVNRKGSSSLIDDAKGKWIKCVRKNIEGIHADRGGVTAVGYLFAKRLNDDLDIPMGIISTSWDGSRIEAWISEEKIFADSDLTSTARWLRKIKDEYKQKVAASLPEIKTWVDDAQKAIENRGTVSGSPAVPVLDIDRKPSKNPTDLYNAMIYPFRDFAIRGFIWYQGESNRCNYFEYVNLQRAMIENFRAIWGLGSLPFYYVQIAPYAYRDNFDTPKFWQAQQKCMEIENTGMAVTIDIGEAGDIHPKNKFDVANRLTLWALAKTYGKDIVYSGPLYKSMEISDGKIMVTFSCFGSQLVTTDDKKPNWFEIAGADGEFVNAKAEIISGDTIAVFSSKVKEPKAVRFAWNELAGPNLSNQEKLPAPAFCTSGCE